MQPRVPLLALLIATTACTSTPTSGGEVKCFEITMMGSAQFCAAATSDVPGFRCPMQLQTGSCPTAGLVGCCVIATPMAELTTTNLGCYYDAMQASNAMASCTGTDQSWSTTLP